MSEHQSREEIIIKIRELAGMLGEMNDSKPVSKSDAENYEDKVLTGLSDAVVEVIDHNIEKLFYWFGYCMLGFEVDPLNDRISVLMEALENEVIKQRDKAMEDDE